MESVDVKIPHISPLHLYTAFMAGGEAVIKQKSYLNKINVFPVPDADTGTNMASTMEAIMENSQLTGSLKTTMDTIADSALQGARGNSGIIFAQFLHGIREEITDTDRLSVSHFAKTLKKTIKYLYNSVIEPVEGTIITVIEDWISSIEKHSKKSIGFTDLLIQSYDAALNSLNETPQKLEILAKKNVVDAGAQGFVNFLDGILKQIKKGEWVKHPPKTQLREVDKSHHIFEKDDKIEFRYCTEAILTSLNKDTEYLKSVLKKYGDSAILAGSSKTTHFHVHTNHPEKLFQELLDVGTITNIKVDDMKRQYETAHARKYPIALVTDSASDLPKDLIEKYQIHMIPFKISFGDNVFLDKITLHPSKFYQLLSTSDVLPHSSQPDSSTVNSLYEQITYFYDKIITVHISKELTGVYNTSIKAGENFLNKKIHVINSKHLSVSEGLITLRVAQAIESGMDYDSIIKNSKHWVSNTRILTDIDSLKYMVKGGRVSPLTGFIAKVINLKPIVTVDKNGKGVAFGKSFSRKANMKKIIDIIKKESSNKRLWNYAIVHSNNSQRAAEYADKLTRLLGKQPVYTVDISPVIGVHNGLGTVAVSYMIDEEKQ